MSLESEGERNTKTFFSEMNCNFPVATDGRFETDPFLKASDALAHFFVVLGTVFSPVRSDITGNVKKLRKFLETNKEGYKYLNDLIVKEAQTNGSVAIDALLWLKRALEFTHYLLTAIKEDTDKNDPPTEDIRPFCLAAYEKTLKPFHGWMVQQIFSLISRACPYRKDLLKALALGHNTQEELIIEELTLVLPALKSNLDIINHLYTVHKLHSDAQV